MGRVEEAVRLAIARAVRQECKTMLAPLAGEVREIRRRVARLETDVGSLRGGEGKAIASPLGRRLVASEQEVRMARLTPAGIKRLRARLGLTQVQLAALLGVTGPAVAQWETGTSGPRGTNRAALVALRKLGRREVGRMLGAAAQGR